MVFTNLLAHADSSGVVDKHWRAIAEETGLPIDDVKAAICELEQPDPESRSPDEDGRRIIRMDGHRAWGWRIVNYGKYRAIRSEDERREQNRLAQERWKAKNKISVSKVRKVSRAKPQSAQAEAEAEAEEKKLPPAAGAEAPPDPVKALWDRGLKLLTDGGVDLAQARSIIGKLRKDCGDIAVMRALDLADQERPSEPMTWLLRTTPTLVTRRASGRGMAAAGPKDYKSGVGPNGAF